MENENKELNKAEQSKDNSKKKKILKYVLNGTVWAIILGFLIYSGLKVIDVKTGYNLLPTHSAVIVSDSMSFVNEANYSYLDKDVEHIKKNDVVHTVNYKNFDKVNKLDVVLYLSENGTLICHRVVDKYIDNGIEYVVTRGDANNIDDAPVRFDLVRGRVNSVTGGGGVVLFFQSPYFVLALCGTGFFILLGYLIFNIKDEKKAAGVDAAVPEAGKVEEKPVEQPKVEEPQKEEPKPHAPKAEELKVEEPKAEAKPRSNGRFVPKGKPQKKINWPPKNTRWTKENNPTTNKKRAAGGDK